MSTDPDVIVIGAGAAGLAAARELQTAGREVLVVDGGARPGGVMQTVEVDGHRVEAGPNTFRAPGPFAAFARRHGLEAVLEPARPESRRRSLYRDGRLMALPGGPLSAVTTRLVSTRAKLRLLAEPFVRRGDPTGETVDAFVSRRLGAEISSRLVGAFLTGVYAGDERELGAEAVFPSLVAAERRSGSIVRGLLAARGEGEPGLPGTWSARGGIAALAASLAEGLDLRLETRVHGLTRVEEGFALETDAGALRARRVVVAAPAAEAAALLGGLDPELAAGLDAIAYAPIAAVALSVDPARVREPVEGFGFLVPRGEGPRLLGCLFPSRLFAERAPAGRELLHCMLGGVRWPEALALADDELVEATLADLDRCLGLQEAPRLLAVRRWPRAVPQPGPEHPRRVAALETAAARVPGLALAGSYLHGVSVADTVLSGVRAAALLA